MHPTQSRTGPAGTRGYTAPEVIHLPHYQTTVTTSTADVWSWGGILYRMTYHTPPAYHRQPYYRPPRGLPSNKDSLLSDVLQHTLAPLPSRVSPPWLAAHRYTNTN